MRDKKMHVAINSLGLLLHFCVLPERREKEKNVLVLCVMNGP